MFLLNSKIKQIDLNLETHTFFKPDENLSITEIIEIKPQDCHLKQIGLKYFK